MTLGKNCDCALADWGYGMSVGFLLWARKVIGQAGYLIRLWL